MPQNSLHDSLMLESLSPQLDGLLLAVARVRPLGNGEIMPAEIVAEARRLFSAIRRLSSRELPAKLSDPAAPVTRLALGMLIVTAQDQVYRLLRHEVNRQPEKYRFRINEMQEFRSGLSPLSPASVE
jgi:hypothetical protein